MARPRINMTGRKNGKLTVRHEIPGENGDRRSVFCDCECGRTRIVRAGNFCKAESCLECKPTPANINRALTKANTVKHVNVSHKIDNAISQDVTAREYRKTTKEDPGLVEARAFSRSCSRGGWV